MFTPQPAVLAAVPALGRFLTFDLRFGADPRASLVRAREALAPESALGVGAPLASALGADVPGLRPFPAISGRGVAFPSTQGALWAFFGGADESAVHDRALAMRTALGDAFFVREEVATFRYREGRDLSGYLDGTANPEGARAEKTAIVTGKGAGLDGSSFVAAQRYVHDLERFFRLAAGARDHVIGRRYADNEEMADAPESAHVKRAEQEGFTDLPNGGAFMVRRSMPWWTEGEQGLYFVAYGATLDPFERVLTRMAGADDGVPDALLGFTRALSGGYYWCPPLKDGQLDLSRLGV